MDPVMGIVGAILITKWSMGLLKQTSGVLLDRQGPDALIDRMRRQIKSLSCKVEIVDLHVWSIGPNIYSAAITVVADEESYLDLIKSEMQHITEIVHTTIEVHQRGIETVE